MKDIDEMEVVEGEIVDDTLEASPLPVSQDKKPERQAGGLEKTGKWMEKIALIGGMACKLFTVFRNSSSVNGYRSSAGKDASRGRKKRRRGKGSV